jgi:iron complex outermembrane receptor protein
LVILGKVSSVPNFQRQIINTDRFSEQWMIIDSFHAAYLSWDRTNNLATSQLNTERYFDYEEFSLEEFYNLILETDRELKTKNLHQKTTIGIEINKNPFFISGEEFQSLNNRSIFPSPYIPRDLISKKNYLGLFIEHEIIIGDRLFVNFEGTLEVASADATDISELPLLEPIENNKFFPEISFDYKLNERMFLFTTVNYSTEPITGIDFRNRSLQSEIYRGLELGIEAELNNNWLATLSFYREIQNNITTIDPNRSQFDLQINEQINNSVTGELTGEIIPGWWLYGSYSYNDFHVTEDEVIAVGNRAEGVARHSGALWTSYQIPRGLGFGAGIAWTAERAGDAANTIIFPGYLQTDLAVFYTQDKFKAAISIENLLNIKVADNAIAPVRIFGTVLWEFE